MRVDHTVLVTLSDDERNIHDWLFKLFTEFKDMAALVSAYHQKGEKYK